MLKLHSLLLALPFTLSCAAPSGGPSTATPPGSARSEPPPAATTTPAASTAASCPTVRQISLGAVSGRVVYPSNMQNHPAFPLFLIRVDDASVFRALHVTPPVDPLTPRAFTIAAVEPGTYVAVGYLTPERVGAYTQAVSCGLGAACGDHTPVRVTVRAGETATGADVLDWAAAPGQLPARPGGSEELKAGTPVRVCNPYADSANIRASAGLGFPVRRTLDNGAAVVVRDGPLAADGYDWYEVNLAGDQAASGWVVGYALRR